MNHSEMWVAVWESAFCLKCRYLHLGESRPVVFKSITWTSYSQADRQHQLSRSRQNSEVSVGLLLTLCGFFYHYLRELNPQQHPTMRWKGLQEADSHGRSSSALWTRETKEAQRFFKWYWPPEWDKHVSQGKTWCLNMPKTYNLTSEEILELVRIVLKLKSWQLGPLLQISRFLCLDLLTEA